MAPKLRLTENETAALAEYVRRLRRQFDGNLLTIILYGSKARGDAAPDSDLDVLTVVRSLDTARKEAISRVAGDLDLTYNVCLAPLTMDAPRYQRLVAERFTLYRNIRRDGFILYPVEDEAVPPPRDLPAVKTTPLIEEDRSGYMSPKEVELYLARAREALQTSMDDISAHHYGAAINRAYYAIFYAASAALASKGIGRSKHSGVASAFRYEFIRTGFIEAEYSDIYRDARKAREDSDYDMYFYADEAIARRTLQDAQQFVARVEEYLRAAGVI